MQKIIIKNFRQISNAEIEIKDFLFLVGEQASGKSTIAKLIYFFKSLKDEYLEIVLENLDKEISEIKALLIKQIQENFRVYFGSSQKLKSSFEIQYYFSVEENSYLKLSRENSLKIEFEYNFFLNISDITYKLKETKKKGGEFKTNLAKEKYNVRFFNRVKDAVEEAFFDKKETVFFPAGRNITVSYPEQFQLLFFSELKNLTKKDTVDVVLMKKFVRHSKFLIDYFNEENEENEETAFEKLIKKIIGDILHGNYKNEDGNERIYYDKNKYVPLNISSSGQQEVIRIIQDAIYILREGNAARIIEEPEAHLFPKAQKLLIQLLILVANKMNSQIIITTHSPFVVSTFNNMLYYTKVIKEQKSKIAEIEDFFLTKGLLAKDNECINMDPNKFQAYRLNVNPNEDYCKSIFDDSIQLIGDNSIDEVTEEINNEFDFLYSKI